MKKLSILTVFAFLALISCAPEQKNEESSQLQKEVAEYINIALKDDMAMSRNEDDNESALNYEVVAVNKNALGDLAFVAGDLLDTSTLTREAEKMFGDYQSKNFISSVSEKYEIVQTLGNLYVKNSIGAFDRVSLKQIVTGNFQPKVKKVDKVYFNNKLWDETSISVGIAFLKLKASKNMRAEVLIKDEISVLLPNENINEVMLKEFIKGLDEKNVGRYYYSYGATLTSITYKTYSKSNWRPAINASWLTLDGKKLLGQENFSYISNVHVDLIPLDKMVFMSDFEE